MHVLHVLPCTHCVPSFHRCDPFSKGDPFDKVWPIFRSVALFLPSLRSVVDVYKLQPFYLFCENFSRGAFPRKLVVIVQDKLFLFQNRSVVLFMISFRQLTALPYFCLGCSLFVFIS